MAKLLLLPCLPAVAYGFIAGILGYVIINWSVFAINYVEVGPRCIAPAVDARHSTCCTCGHTLANSSDSAARFCSKMQASSWPFGWRHAAHRPPNPPPTPPTHPPTPTPPAPNRQATFFPGAAKDDETLTRAATWKIVRTKVGRGALAALPACCRAVFTARRAPGQAPRDVPTYHTRTGPHLPPHPQTFHLVEEEGSEGSDSGKEVSTHGTPSGIAAMAHEIPAV